MGFNRALRAVRLEPTDKILLMGSIGDAKFAEKVLGIKDFNSEKERLLAVHEALDVDMTFTLGLRKWPSPSLPTQKATKYGTFEELKEGFPYTDAFHVAYKDFKLARSKAASSSGL